MWIIFHFIGTASEEGETEKDPEIQIERDETLNKVNMKKGITKQVKTCSCIRSLGRSSVCEDTQEMPSQPW